MAFIRRELTLTWFIGIAYIAVSNLGNTTISAMAASPRGSDTVSKTQNASSAQKQETTYTGSINGRYPIEMKLQRAGSKFTGQYRYTSKKTAVPLTLKGEETSGLVNLTEKDKAGKETGRFEGQLQNGEFWGTWTKSDGTTFPFSVATSATRKAPAGGVGITRKQARLWMDDDMRRGIVNKPIVSGLPPGVLKKVQREIDPETLFGKRFENGEDVWKGWMDEISYETLYNRNNLLSLRMTMSGCGAYPDASDKTVVINLKDGKRLKAKDLFATQKLTELAKKLDMLMHQEIEKDIAERDSQDEKDEARSALSTAKFTVANLDTFFVDDKGVTFIYDYGLPHVIQALEPNGEFLLTYRDLRPFILPAGPIGKFINDSATK